MSECLIMSWLQEQDTGQVVLVLITDTTPELTIYQLEHIATVKRHFPKSGLTQQKLKTSKQAASCTKFEYCSSNNKLQHKF